MKSVQRSMKAQATARSRSAGIAMVALLIAGTSAWAQGVFSTPQEVGVASGQQTVTVTAQAAGRVATVEVLTLGAANLDFNAGSGVSTCVVGFSFAAPGATCAESVTFTPLYPGRRIGAVVLLDGSGNVLATAYLSGVGVGGLGVLVPGITFIEAGVVGSFTSIKDGIPANQANLNQPASLTVDGVGNMYIADSAHNRIRVVAPLVPPATAGIISTFAGTGSAGYSGDRSLATDATLNTPSGVALDGAGNLYIADTGNNVIRKVDAATGIITTAAGTGAPGYRAADDGNPAIAAELNQPEAVTIDGGGNLFIADTSNQRIRRVDAVTGIITTVAGNGAASGNGDGRGTFSGDNGPATSAGLSLPYAVAFDSSGNMFIPDSANNRIRRVDAVTHKITTVAGTGGASYTGDRGPATRATLYSPSGVAVDAAGDLFIADTQNSRIRKVNAAGTITTVIANFTMDLYNPQGAPGSIQLYAPIGLYLRGNGDLYFADYLNMVVEKIQSNLSYLSFIGTPVIVGNQSAPIKQTIENDGNAAFDLTAITPDLNTAIDPGTTTCTLAPLPVNANCQVGVIFAPDINTQFPIGALSLLMEPLVEVDGTTVGYPSDPANTPLDIVAVGKALPVNSTIVTVIGNPNPSNYGDEVTFTATVTTGGGKIPVGTVVFKDGATTLGVPVGVNLSGVAVYSTTAPLTVGAHTITASFTGQTGTPYLPNSGTMQQIVNEATATTLTSPGPNPSITGANLTFTATVTTPNGGGVIPDGTVTFMDTTTGTVIGIPQTLPLSGIVSISTAALAAGAHAITATYSGDSTKFILGSLSTVLNQDVQNTTTTLLTSSLNPSTYGTTVTFTSTVTSGGTPITSGTVSFLDGNTVIGSATLSGIGTASLQTSTLTAGSHTITAVFQSTTSLGTSTSTPITQIVNAAATATTVAAVPNPGIAGAPVVITATVQMTAGSAPMTGTVTFTDNGASLGAPVLLTAGTATISPTLAPGTHSIVASYSGDANDNSSTSAPYALPVVQATTQVALAASPNPSIVLQQVTFTAVVSGNGGIPQGSVSFTADGSAIGGPAALDATGTATLTTSSLPVGTHAIVAIYSGDVNDAASQSSTLSQVVGTIPTVTNLGITTTTGANPQIVLVATVLNNPSVATVGSLPLPTGTVTFSYGTTVIGSAAIDANGVATLIPNLNSGTYSFVASYGGDTDHAPSSSTATLFSTTPLGFNLTVTPNPVNIPQTENATVTVTLASANGFTDTIGLGCASLPSGVNCRFAVSDPTLTADGTQIVQLIIDTNNPLGGGARAMNGPPESRRFTLAGLSLPLSLFLGMAIWGFRRRNRAFFVVLLMLLSGGAMLVSGCSGFSQSSAKPGTYVIQVTGTGTASNITHYQNVTLNITAK